MAHKVVGDVKKRIRLSPFVIKFIVQQYKQMSFPALLDKFYKMRQLRFVKGDCVRLLMSGYEGFRVESEGFAPVKD